MSTAFVPLLLGPPARWASERQKCLLPGAGGSTRQRRACCLNPGSSCFKSRGRLCVARQRCPARLSLSFWSKGPAEDNGSALVPAGSSLAPVSLPRLVLVTQAQAVASEPPEAEGELRREARLGSAPAHLAPGGHRDGHVGLSSEEHPCPSGSHMTRASFLPSPLLSPRPDTRVRLTSEPLSAAASGSLAGQATPGRGAWGRRDANAPRRVTQAKAGGACPVPVKTWGAARRAEPAGRGAGQGPRSPGASRRHPRALPAGPLHGLVAWPPGRHGAGRAPLRGPPAPQLPPTAVALSPQCPSLIPTPGRTSRGAVLWTQEERLFYCNADRSILPMSK